MLRLIGSMALGTVCAMYGFGRAAALMRRRDFLRSFLSALSVIETEICFGRRTLGEIFSGLDSPELCGLFTDCTAGLEASGIKYAWQSAAASAAAVVGLNADEKSIITSLGAELGRTAAEGQKKVLGRAAAYISSQLEMAEDEYRRMGRVYRSCGVLAGAMCVLIFI